MSKNYSYSPDGEKLELPSKEDYESEFERLQGLVEKQRNAGREIVVVVGLGFVGAVMAAVVADAKTEKDKLAKFVIGMQRPSTRSFWKIKLMNKGIAPLKADDPEIEPMIRRCVLDNKNLVATYTEEALRLADVVIVDVQCDYIKESLGDVTTGYVDMADLKNTFHMIAERIPPESLVIIETTVPPGTTELIAYPIIKTAFQRRDIKTEPFLAHSYERVMPGRNYAASVRDSWRVCSGINEESRNRVVKFLNSVINTRDYPLTVLERPIESETAKVVENSFRAAILALMDEWSLFAEQNGVDLIKVINAIKVRPTHSNILFPGPGIGGYCLPKDGALGMWAYKHILGGNDSIFRMTPETININDMRGLRVGKHVEDALREMGRSISGAQVVVLGASYKQDVGDTRNSGSEVVVRRLAEMGAEIRVHDPYVQHWWEFEAQDSYPSAGHSKGRFFQNQERLKNLRISQDLKAALRGVDAVILAVRHRQYLGLDPDQVVGWIGKPSAIIDCFGILDDKSIGRYFQLGCEVRGLGRGHIARIKEAVKRS